MKETLKMLQQIIIGYEEGRSDEELIEEYKHTKKANILAYMFKQHYGIIHNTSLLYPILNTDDIASFTLQELDKALLNYDGMVKFNTYFIKCLKNRFRVETKMLLHNKRKAIIDYESIDNYDSIYYDDYFNFDDFVSYNHLTTNQKNVCKLIGDGYTIKEISKILNKSIPFVYKERYKIKKKILNFV